MTLAQGLAGLVSVAVVVVVVVAPSGAVVVVVTVVVTEHARLPLACCAAEAASSCCFSLARHSTSVKSTFPCRSGQGLSGCIYDVFSSVRTSCSTADGGDADDGVVVVAWRYSDRLTTYDDISALMGEREEDSPFPWCKIGSTKGTPLYVRRGHVP